MAQLVQGITGYPLSIDQAAALCRVSRRTVYRWERTGWPPLARAFAELHTAGRVLPRSWLSNCRFDQAGNLHTSAGTLNQAQVLGIDYQLILIDDLRRALERTRKENRALRARLNEVISDCANDAYQIP